MEEKDQTIGALKRNFKSVSELCIKAETERNQLEVVKNSLQKENKEYASEVLAHLQTIKKL